MKYIDLSEVQEQQLLEQANIVTHIAKKNIEKDWWVTQVLSLWRKDYENMRQSMIYGTSVSFDELLNEMRKLNDRIRALPYVK